MTATQMFFEVPWLCKRAGAAAWTGRGPLWRSQSTIDGPEPRCQSGSGIDIGGRPRGSALGRDDTASL